MMSRKKQESSTRGKTHVDWLCRNTRVLIKRRSMKQRAMLSMEPEETEVCLVKNVTLVGPRKRIKNLRLCWTPVFLTQRMQLIEYPSYREREYFAGVPLLARLANGGGWWELGFRNIWKPMFPIPAIASTLGTSCPLNVNGSLGL